MKIKVVAFLIAAALACACGKEKNQDEDGFKYEAVFIGDSITANWVKADKGHPEFFNSHNYLCLGYSGKTTATLKTYFKLSVIDKHPRQAVISGGTNDIAGNDGRQVPVEEIRDNIAWMAAEAAAKGIRVVLCSVTPSKGFSWASSVSHPETTIIQLNTLIRALADEKGYAYADYHSALTDSGGGMQYAYSSDGTHPNKDGYTVMEGVIQPILEAI